MAASEGVDRGYREKKNSRKKYEKIQEKFSSLELLMTDDARTAYGEVKWKCGIKMMLESLINETCSHVMRTCVRGWAERRI